MVMIRETPCGRPTRGSDSTAGLKEANTDCLWVGVTCGRELLVAPWAWRQPLDDSCERRRSCPVSLRKQLLPMA